MTPFSFQPCLTSRPQWSADWKVGAHWGRVTAQVVIRRVTMVAACSTLSPISELVAMRLYVVVVVAAVTAALVALILVSTSLILVEQALEGQTICKRSQKDQ